jgi:phosphoribosylformylglycinamidine synthase
MCRAFGTPVTGGNVSLYNENPSGAIDPTPTVGMVGLIEDASHVTTQFFKSAGDAILLLGGLGDELGGSQYLAVVHGRREGLPPRLDVARELALQEALRALIRAGKIRSAHDCSEGGLAVALAECCISGADRVGAQVALDAPGVRPDVLLFNESQSRIVVSVRAAEGGEVLAQLAARGVPARQIGTVGGEELAIRCPGGRYAWPLDELYHAWHDAIAGYMEGC